MTPEAWIAFGGLLLTLIVTLIGVAYTNGRLAGRVAAVEKAVEAQAATTMALGRLTERIAGLEKDGADHGGLALAFAEFRGEVRAVMTNQTDAIAKLHGDMGWLKASTSPAPASRRRTPP